MTSQAKWQQQWRQQWQQSREQWQANPRLQWGVWAIGLLFLLWLNLLVSDWRAELAQDYQYQHELLQEQQSLAGNTQWPERLAQAREASEQQAKRFGRAPSESLARAAVQTRVAELLASAGLEKARIEVSAAPAANSENQLLALQLRVSGRGAGDALMAFMQSLEQGTPALQIDNLTVNNQQNKYLIYTLIASVWYHPFSEEQ